MNKYKLTNEFIEFKGEKLFRIIALRNFSNVKTGELGGFIKDESNLNQKDYSWVHDNSIVCGNSIVCEDSIVENSTVENSKIENSTIENSKIENSIVDNSKIENSTVYKYSVVEKSTVRGNSTVENSTVRGNSLIVDIQIDKNPEIKTFGCLGSRNLTLTIIKDMNYVATGCFHGTKEEFLKKVEETYGRMNLELDIEES